MDSAVMFSRQSDEWATPRPVFEALDAEFGFTLDAAATAINARCDTYLTREQDALHVSWGQQSVWLNPPYSQCAVFLAKAAAEVAQGCTVVCLVPSRTDTRWWHRHVWDATRHQPRPGVEIRFLPGRLKFSDAKNAAPFPSVVLVFRPVSPDNARAVNGCNARGF